MKVLGKRIGICFCGNVGRLTDHHVIPIEVKATSKQVIAICNDCHNELHLKYTNKQLAEFSILELLFILQNGKLTRTRTTSYRTTN